MKVNIDETAGFCWGVVRTVNKAEETISDNKDKKIYVLGDIIHNPKEIQRLAKKGLETISVGDLSNIDSKNSKVIIRAHGEPPSTFEKADEFGLNIIDATCPIVTALQQRVKRIHSKGYQIVIYGKPNHPEVIGIRGGIKDDCIIITNVEEALQKVDFSLKTALFSQTTMEKTMYFQIRESIESKVKSFIDGGELKDNFKFKNTLCKQVWGRDEKVLDFARSNDLIIFVAGRNSSNGKSLFKHMKTIHQNMYYIEDSKELNPLWFENINSVGISGATSTPQWYMDEVKEKIEERFL